MSLQPAPSPVLSCVLSSESDRRCLLGTSSWSPSGSPVHTPKEVIFCAWSLP